MSWIQLTFLTSAEVAEKLSDLMHDYGAVAVTLKEGGAEEIFEPPIGETPLWQDTQVVGLFEGDQSIETTLSLIKQNLALDDFPEYQQTRIEDQDWERAWLADFKPMQFGKKLWIVPSAYEPVDKDAVNIFLDPGLAFGTGTHPTTALCLAWLDEHKVIGQDVIDYGCGSGVLGIAAAKLGAKMISAVDIDPQAITATDANSEKNNVAENIESYLPESFPEKAADLLLANILANPLMDLAEHFAELLKDSGQVVLSGILEEQAEDVLAVYRQYFNMGPVVTLDGWVMLQGKKI
ncbi:MAG: 50S ribosomal protein L11 methyltransferase [Gammaproteobacteria bacterium]|nr:50S ribosomal protein L11 methyltransferase [Gammaproteobacteria bacterium]